MSTEVAAIDDETKNVGKYLQVATAVSGVLVASARAPRGPDGKHTRATKIALGTSLAMVGAQVGTEAYTFLRARYRRSKYLRVSIEGNDFLFQAAARWLFQYLPEDQSQSVLAETEWVHGAERKRVLQLTPDAKNFPEVKVDIGGHEITISFDTPQPASGGKNDDPVESGYSSAWRVPRLMFSATTVEGRTAVLQHLDNLLSEAKDKPGVHIAGKWGWSRRDDLPHRSLDTIILRKGLQEDLCNDIGNFLKDEERYAALGAPWHRGYLLHGPPGTGKTSIARALASHFGLDLYYLPLSDVESDMSVSNIVSELKPRSMLLLEDIDVLHAATVRDDTQSKGLSLSGLLNALDGVMTPHGLITMMTTNDISVLDSALIRPGRADRTISVFLPDPEQIQRMLAKFAPETLNFLDPQDLVGASTASIAEAVKANLRQTPEVTARALLELSRTFP